MNLFKKLFQRAKNEEADKLKDKVCREKKKTLKELKNINKEVKLLMEQGSIEVIVKNVKGVIEETKR